MCIGSEIGGGGGGETLTKKGKRSDGEGRTMIIIDLSENNHREDYFGKLAVFNNFDNLR